MDAPREHVPVLFQEVLDGLDVRPGRDYVDATVGAGGHSAGILDASTPGGRLLGLDADPNAISFAAQVLREYQDRVTLKVSNFQNLKSVATSLQFDAVDGVLADLGISSRQLDDVQRGFSFRFDGPLDMRMDPNLKESAADLVNNLAEEDLSNILWQYGEERKARRIARAIVDARPIRTTDQLAELVARIVGRKEKIHPATRTFQALRIATNDELQALTQVLPQARDLLRSGGRVAIISFHSLEDRIVKEFFRQEAQDCLCPPEVPMCVCQHRASLRIITRKPLRPAPEEVNQNPRSRSARLRIAERL